MSLRALFFRRPPDPQLIEIAFDGEVYPVELRRHAQARRYTLRVRAATRAIVLTMPMRGSVREAKAFAQRNGGWIAARLKRLPQDLQGEFPHVSPDTIERTVDAGARELLAQARFHDFVPVLVHKAVRAQLLARS